MSLNEEIQVILQGKGNKNEKAQALYKIGLRKYDVEILLHESIDKEKAASKIFRTTFGVEIECCVNRSLLTQKAQELGFNFQYEGYNHNDNMQHFKFVTDASIDGANAIECVSPILKGNKGMNDLKKACKALNAANASVNRSCGLHVHIGTKNLTEQQFSNVFANYKHLENVIDTFMAESRRANNNRYCQSLSLTNRGYIDNAKNVREVQYAMHNDRYYKINAMSYNRHKTIEFRQHQGTTDFTKIQMWVNFCTKLVGWSRNVRLTNDITSIDEIPFLTANEKEFFKNRAIALQS